MGYLEAIRDNNLTQAACDLRQSFHAIVTDQETSDWAKGRASSRLGETALQEYQQKYPKARIHRYQVLRKEEVRLEFSSEIINDEHQFYSHSHFMETLHALKESSKPFAIEQTMMVSGLAGVVLGITTIFGLGFSTVCLTGNVTDLDEELAHIYQGRFAKMVLAIDNAAKREGNFVSLGIFGGAVALCMGIALLYSAFHNASYPSLSLTDQCNQ